MRVAELDESVTNLALPDFIQQRVADTVTDL
jgi:hypothetical protein